MSHESSEDTVQPDGWLWIHMDPVPHDVLQQLMWVNLRYPLVLSQQLYLW